MECQLSIIIVSFNTVNLLREVLNNVKKHSNGLAIEIIVIDNASKDNSVQMVQQEFPDVKLIPSAENIGFGAANNLGAKSAKGKYLVLLNSDAFLKGNALKIAYDLMEQLPEAGLGGAKLLGRDGSLQPSSRKFPNLWNYFLMISGNLDELNIPGTDHQTDWVPGAFCIIPRKVFEQVNGFDERFFLYYEEVDLCIRIKQAGYQVWYFPEVEVIHLGGESAKTVSNLELNGKGMQLTLWEMRSAFLYWHKNKGTLGAYSYYAFNRVWQGLRKIKHGNNSMFGLLKQAWKDTKGGTFSPPRPW